MQDAQLMHNQLVPQSQPPARPPFPMNSSSAKGMRTSSNPERGQTHPQGGSPRNLPGPPGQIPAPHSHFPLPRFTSSTEVLEHIHPGSTSRGDFHSDLTAQNTIDTYNSGPPNNYIAIPSRGLPGPFGYQQILPQNQPVPLSNPSGIVDRNLPKGKRNPKKKSSDDARMATSTENGPRQVSNAAYPKGSFPSRNLQMPFNPQSPPLVQEVRLFSKGVPYSGNYHHSTLPPGHYSGNWQAPFRHPPYIGQAPTQPIMEGHELPASNPFQPSALDLHGFPQDPRPSVASLPISGNMQHQVASATEQLFEESAGLVTSHMQSRISQPIDPHAFGQQPPDRRSDAQHQHDHVRELQRPALAPVPNAGQSQFPGNPEHSRASEISRRSVQENCRIWIGGIPNEFDKVAVMGLLRPCRGLFDVTMPKLPSTSKTRNNYSYAFAEYVIPMRHIALNTNCNEYSFHNPADAAEALERLPQTRFASLPEGIFLSTNYAKSKVHSSPSHYQHGRDGASKWPVSNISPIKSRKSEDSNNGEKSNNEHGRKSSKSSARWRKQPANIPEEKPGKPSERVSPTVTDKESSLHPEEAIATSGPDGKTGTTPHVSQPWGNGPDSMPINQNLRAIQPDNSVESHANQVSRTTGDGTLDTSSAPRVRESYQATSSGHTEGRTKSSKKKSKDFNKLPAPKKKESEPPTVNTASENSKPNFQAGPSMNEAIQVLGNSSQTEEKGRQAVFEVEAGKMIDSIPLELTSTLPKDLGAGHQSFLGCSPTEDDGEPKASVICVPKAEGAKDDETELSETEPSPLGTTLSAVTLKQSEEPNSQAMRRGMSNSTQGSVDTNLSILSYTGPPSSSQTERSNSISQEELSPMVQAASPSSRMTLLPQFSESDQLRDRLEASIVNSSVSQSGSVAASVRAFDECGSPQGARPAGEVPMQIPEPGKSLAPSDMRKATDNVEELQNPAKGDTRTGMGEENPEQIPNMLSMQPSPSSKSDRSFFGSPARKRALSIPPRTSSLAAPSTPIKTHQKKKPRNLPPMKEASLSKDTSLPDDGTTRDSNLQTTASMKLNFPVLTIHPAARTLTTDKSKELPKPETPFLMDDGVRVTPPKITHQVVEASNADRYYEQKDDYQVSDRGCAMQIDTAFCSLDPSDLASTHPSEISTPNRVSAKEPNDLETTLREAGYRSLSGTSPFTIKDPELAFLETIDEQGNLLENCINKEESVLTWADDKGKIAVMSLDLWTKQNEMMDVVKKATAVKRLLADVPSSIWTKIESLRQRLSRFVTPFFSDGHKKRQTTNAKAQKILKAMALLNTIPRRDASISEMQKWSRKASLLMEANASEPTRVASEYRKSTTNSPSKSSRGTSLQRQQQEHRNPVLINQPNPHILARKLGRDEDTFPFAVFESNDSLTSGQTTESEPSPSTCGRRTPSEEESMALIPPTVPNQITRLKDLFEIGEGRLCWSDDRHRSCTPQEEDRTTTSDPDFEPLIREFDGSRVTQEKDREQPGQGIKETDNQMQQKPHVDKPCKCKGEELGSEEVEQDRRLTAQSNKYHNPTFLASKEKVPQEPEDPAHQKQSSQPLDLSFSSFGSNHTASNEDLSEEAQNTRPRGGHSPLKRSGYNAVAGRGVDWKRSGQKKMGKDPWALPQGEKPWGSGCEGRGGRKKREGQL